MYDGPGAEAWSTIFRQVPQDFLSPTPGMRTPVYVDGFNPIHAPGDA